MNIAVISDIWYISYSIKIWNFKQHHQRLSKLCQYLRDKFHTGLSDPTSFTLHMYCIFGINLLVLLMPQSKRQIVLIAISTHTLGIPTPPPLTFGCSLGTYISCDSFLTLCDFYLQVIDALCAVDRLSNQGFGERKVEEALHLLDNNDEKVGCKTSLTNQNRLAPLEFKEKQPQTNHDNWLIQSRCLWYLKPLNKFIQWLQAILFMVQCIRLKIWT